MLTSKTGLALFLLLTLALLQGTLTKEKVRKGHYQPTLDLTKLNWFAARYNSFKSEGVALSANFGGKAWSRATVPGSVLTTLLKNNQIQDPLFGLNNHNITDANDDVEYYKYWFSTKFNLSETQFDSHLRIHFRGINYKAEAFLNGRRINTETMIGMFRTFSYEVTELANVGENILSVLVMPPDPAGDPNGSPAGDGEICRSVTAQYLAGWDFSPAIKDRGTGIWDKVYMTFNGPVRFEYVHVKPRVPDIRFPGRPSTEEDPAFLSSVFLLDNIHADRQSIGLKAQLSYEVLGTDVSGTIKLSLLPGSKYVKGEFPEIQIEEPMLWWPNTYGPQNVYTIRFEIYYELSDPTEKKYTLSDVFEESFGFRNISTSLVELDRSEGRVFYVNGQRIFIKGANWVGLHMMFRNQSTTSYAEAIRHLADMNLNMIRVWGGSIIERPEFYEECDKQGLLVWQDLPITGECNGRWEDLLKKSFTSRRKDFPDSHSLFLDSVRDSLFLLRNHPSLAIWCGGSGFNPPNDIEIQLVGMMAKLDPDRLYARDSLSDGFGPDEGPNEIQPPEWFYRIRDESPFNPMIGSVGFPTAETVSEMMSQDHTYPLGLDNEVWNYHSFLEYKAPEILDQLETYGEATTLQHYAQIAQIVNYVQYKSIMESRLIHMWEWYSGLLLWKANSPFSSMRAQLYDVFGEQTASYFGVKKAGRLQQAMLDLATHKVAIVNHDFEPTTFSIDVRVYPIGDNGATVGAGETGGTATDIEVDETSVKSGVLSVDLDEGTSEVGIYFVELTLWKGNQVYNLDVSDPVPPASLLVGSNVYWVASQGRHERFAESLFSPLRSLKAPQVSVFSRLLLVEDFVGSADSSGKMKYCVKLTVTNDPTSVLFFSRLSVRKLASSYENSSRILPVYYDDNYFTLMPHRTTTTHLYFEALPSSQPTIWLEALNLPPQMVISYKSGAVSEWDQLPEWEAARKRECFDENPESPLRCCYGNI